MHNSGHFSEDGGHFVEPKHANVVAVPLGARDTSKIAYPVGDCAASLGDFVVCSEDNLKSSPPAGVCAIPKSSGRCDHLLTKVSGPFVKVRTKTYMYCMYYVFSY